MRRLATFMHTLGNPAKALVVTAMAVILSHVVIYDLMSVSFFSPLEKAADFRFSDFYTLVANGRAVRTLDPDIVIVAVDGCNRQVISRAIDDIDFCSPAAVGLDIAFSAPTDPEADQLAQSLSTCANLVMPVTVSPDGTVNHVSYYDSVATPAGGFAAVNIQGEEDARTTVREFAPYFGEGDSRVMSLGAALASIARPTTVTTLKARRNNEEAISFISRDFEVIAPDEIIDNADLIKGKIVLVGKMRDAADLHPTPLDNFTPGIVIHAHTTATILSGNFTRRLTTLEIYLLATAACYAVVLLNLCISATPLGTFLVRGIQLLMLYLMILTGTAVYIRYNVDLNFAYVMITTSLGVAACDIFHGLFAPKGLLDAVAARLEQKKKKYETDEKNSSNSPSRNHGVNDVGHLAES